MGATSSFTRARRPAACTQGPSTRAVAHGLERPPSYPQTMQRPSPTCDLCSRPAAWRGPIALALASGALSCAGAREWQQPIIPSRAPTAMAITSPAEAPAPEERGVVAMAAASAAKDPAASADTSAAARETSQAPAKSSTDEEFPIHGSLTSRYRYRTGGGGQDQDLYETLVLDAGDRKRNGFTAHVMATLFADLDGRRDRDDQFVFPSLADTFNEPVQPILYQAFVDIDKPPLVGELRVGRQFDYFTPEFAHFDGVRVATAPAGKSKVVAGAYGGVPVRIYDATSIGDSILGLWGEGQPWGGGRVRLDWMHVDDDDRFGANSNDLLGATVWQRLTDNARMEARYTRLENEDRDVRLRANWDDPEADLRLQASYYQLLETQRNFANEFDPFFSTLQDYFPFGQVRLQGSKGLSRRTRLDAGVDVRRVNDSSDEGAFNRDFDREWLSLVLLDRFAPGLTFTLTADLWNSDQRDIQTWGLDASRDLKTGLRWSLGSNYALYRYDYFSGNERDNVRVWYARLRKDIGRGGSVDLRYDYEEFDGDTFHVVLVGATWRF